MLGVATAAVADNGSVKKQQQYNEIKRLEQDYETLLRVCKCNWHLKKITDISVSTVYCGSQVLSACIFVCVRSVSGTLIYIQLPLRTAWPGSQWSDTPHSPSRAGRYGCTAREILHQTLQRKTGTHP